MKFLAVLLLLLFSNFQSSGNPLSIGENLLDSFGNKGGTAGMGIFLTEEDTHSITRLKSKDFVQFFAGYKLFRCKFHLIAGDHHQYEWCLVLTTAKDRIIEVQKRLYWSGVNEQFWNSLRSVPLAKYSVPRAFQSVIDMLYTLEEVYLDSSVVHLQRPSSKTSHNTVNSRPIINDNSISTEFYRKVLDESSPTLYALSPSFFLVGIFDERLTIKAYSL